MIVQECLYCGAEFDAERSTAKYCCDSHKTLAYRQRREQEEFEESERCRQAAFEKYQLQLFEERKIKANQEEAERAEQHRKLEAERLASYETRRKEDQERRKNKHKKLQKLNTEQSQSSMLKINLAVFAGLAVLSLATGQINAKDKKDKV